LFFIAGWLVPRDAFPWMCRLSAWLMRERDNRALAWQIMLLAAVGLVPVLLFTGCGKREIPSDAPAPTVRAWLSAEGKSMLPSFPEHALVEVEFGVPFDALREGDSVVFWDYKRGAQALTHHRLKQKQGSAWIARGDNNTVVDESWVTRDNYLGRTTGRHTQMLFARQ
jgi:hypothetical protein